jgi:hypothetical protein
MKADKQTTKQADSDVLMIFDKYEGMKYGAIIDDLGRRGLIKDANYNWQYITAYLKHKTPANYRRELLKFKKVFNELKTSEGKLNL